MKFIGSQATISSNAYPHISGSYNIED